ncbi:MAG: type II toxin-antitoxin system prevent-host-death family antitoxin [Alphaproteobacteria bacterium]|nr:type II toxin-antitoxin system prevent-host-death family antitoxin [Alphaproteobacteria bacterium]
MACFTAYEARRNFGAVLKAADEGAVVISKHGRNGYVLMPMWAFVTYEHIRQANAEGRLAVSYDTAVAKYREGDRETAFKIIRETNSLMKRLLEDVTRRR